VALVGTHSHAGVGGYLNNLLPQFTSIGFVRQAYDAIVDGTVHAISEAHNSMVLGTLSIGNTTVDSAGVNRSPSAYLRNPLEERTRYDGDVEREMTLLKFQARNGREMGFLSFFAVHGTSLYNVGISTLSTKLSP
jgi:neutral ceramidase